MSTEAQAKRLKTLHDATSANINAHVDRLCGLTAQLGLVAMSGDSTDIAWMVGRIAAASMEAKAEADRLVSIEARVDRPEPRPLGTPRDFTTLRVDLDALDDLLAELPSDPCAGYVAQPEDESGPDSMDGDCSMENQR
jgi:hypothetical protein